MANLNNECSCRGENPNCFKCEGTGIMSLNNRFSNSPGYSSNAKFLNESKTQQAHKKKKNKRFKSKSESSLKFQNIIQPSVNQLSQNELSAKSMIDELNKHLILLNNEDPSVTVICPLCKCLTNTFANHLVHCLGTRSSSNLKRVYSQLMNLKELTTFVEIAPVETEANSLSDVNEKKIEATKKPLAKNTETLLTKTTTQRHTIFKKAIENKYFIKLFRGKVCYFCNSNYTSLLSHLIQCNSLRNRTNKEVAKLITKVSLKIESNQYLDLEKDRMAIEIQHELFAGKTHTFCPFCNQNIENFYEHSRVCKLFTRYSTNQITDIFNKQKVKLNLNANRRLNHVKPRLADKSNTSQNIQKDFNYKAQERNERRMDASKDFFTFREQGRFGSHPVHDDYGEEGEI